MIVAIGVDVCAIERIATISTTRPRVLHRLFTPSELADERPARSLAGYFAAKEALAKALGAPDGLSWQDAEVCIEPNGAPRLQIRDSVAARAHELGITNIHLSITHDAGVAVAFVVCERET